MISDRLGIPYIQTDNLVWNRTDNTKHSAEARDRLLDEVLMMEDWIIEGVHHKWEEGSFREADYIFILRPAFIHPELPDGQAIRQDPAKA